MLGHYNNELWKLKLIIYQNPIYLLKAHILYEMIGVDELLVT